MTRRRAARVALVGAAILAVTAGSALIAAGIADAPYDTAAALAVTVAGTYVAQVGLALVQPRNRPREETRA